jgi:putative methyltransferase (TIGR01177 family)
MTEWFVELSGANLPLGRAELVAAVEAEKGRWLGPADETARLERVELPDGRPPSELAGRLGLARRILGIWTVDAGGSIEERLRGEAARTAGSASFRPLGRPTSTPRNGLVAAWAAAWKSGGGHIDLTAPQRRFVYLETPAGPTRFGEVVAEVDGVELERHRMPRLPFQRPVSLPPRLARAAANLARVRPGDRVVDPFVGTGALLLEAASLGARVSGVDRDAGMVRGTIQNLAHFGVQAERLLVEDAAAAAARFAPGSVRAIVTDPPYGRASGTAGEAPGPLVRRVLSAWADRVAPDGRIVVVVPGGPSPLDAPWRLALVVPDRVHRSLTREFRVYERGAPDAAAARPSSR